MEEEQMQEETILTHQHSPTSIKYGTRERMTTRNPKRQQVFKAISFKDQVQKAVLPKAYLSGKRVGFRDRPKDLRLLRAIHAREYLVAKETNSKDHLVLRLIDFNGHYLHKGIRSKDHL